MYFEVNTAKSAAADLAAVVDYWMKIDPELAVQFHGGIIDHIDSLRTNPFVGDIIKRTRKQVIRITHYRTYRIFFSVNEIERTVEVLRIRHVKRRSLKSLE